MNGRDSVARLAVALVALTQFVLVAPAWGASATRSNTFVTVFSTSRQFAASANDEILPPALCVYFERVKREWLQRLGMADNWRDRIVLVVRQREAAQQNLPATTLVVFQTDEHLRYQIYCFIPPRIDQSRLLAAIVEALCSEWANREQTIARGTQYAPPAIPPWVVYGLAGSIQGHDEALLSVVQRSVAGGRPPPAAAVLFAKAPPANPLDQQLFQANAWILTEGLLALPDGPQKLRDFLAELGAQKVASQAFWTVYQHDFRDERALEKWWSLDQAGYMSATLAQNLSAHDTLHRLDAVLVTKLGPLVGPASKPGEKEVAIGQLWRYADAPWLKDVLKLKIDRLGALRSQGHPIFQPVLDQYIAAIVCLYHGSVVRFRRGVEHADAARAAAEQESARITAYMDEAERIDSPEEVSKAFAGYFQTLDQFQKMDEERRSPISDYLDKFDR